MTKTIEKSISIIGLGPFSQFFIPILKPYFKDISAWNRSNKLDEALALDIKYVSLKEALSKEIIILSTSVSYFEEMLKNHFLDINPNALVFDVASVKLKPVEMMHKYLPSTCEIIATHPLFGPQSGKNGIKDKKIVICPVRTSKLDCVIDFFKNELELNVLIKTPDEHDREMAYVQGLTHFIARAVSGLNIQPSDQKTDAYQALLEIKKLLGGDNYELFLAIQNDNPYAKQVRIDFIKKLHELNLNLK